MSNGGGSSSSSNGKIMNGVSSIPAASRKMVQSLKEIVNCPDHEIYAMLKECNMDPNETVNRLLAQDPFHEVKSKREKKKEIKETTESRSRGVSSATNRGGRGGMDRNAGRSGSAQFSSNEPGVTRGKAAYKKENGASAIPSSSSASGIAGHNTNRKSTSLSDSVSAENTVPMMGSPDIIPFSSQPSPGFQPAWMGVPGQVSMADIVRMGRPHGKASNVSAASTETSYPPHNANVSSTSPHSVKHPPVSMPLPSESYHDLHSTQDPASKVSEIIPDQGIAVNQHISCDEWPLVEQSPGVSGSSVADSAGASVLYAEPPSSSTLHVDRTTLHLNSRLDEVQVTEGIVAIDNLTAEASDRQLQGDDSGGGSHFDDNSFENRSSYQPQRLAFEHQEVEDVGVTVSSAAASLQQLSLQKGEVGARAAEGSPAVIIPDHLQVPTADFSHLSFGSFGSGLNPTFSGSFASKALKSNLEEPSVADAPPVESSDTRNPEYYGNEQLRPASNENVDSPSSSQPEVVKHDNPVEATHGHQYPFPSVAGYSFENATQANAAAYSYPHTNPQMQNLAPFSSVMAYTNSLPSNLLASSVQPVRESDLANSPFLATQSMPTKYSSAMSSISGPTISMPESVKPGVFSTPQPAPQTLPSTNIPTGPTHPQHLPVHAYSQPTLPLGHFTNMVSYPFLPPSYAYMPSAFQQAYAGNSAFHQSPAAVHSGGIKYSLPQYKNSVSVSSLPQSAAVASGYGGLGSSTNLPGSYMLNPSTTPPSTTIGYEDVLSSQYKDSNHFLSLQQNEGPAMWVHGPGSRTMSAVPASTYYSLQGQNQQSGFRQGQQPSHYGALGYPNFYHSQAGVSQEHQQAPNDGTLSSSQGPPSQQSHQIWQHSY
ncbi:actin cytoskeleton-regulatory complex protein PAN1-like isoform X2 [Magnolia sinica]|uniref:actin cytoskeleton-regulatory complex protein PAN1-like isoform X2 n=1 Tax=Magnolia sinica TaxID=86752 RepID=UPI0026580AF5|nr:actin cytoskeleton-regulatory complex protein PAN1-like isoform X2 [Magnolia sinica]